jgi:hypothetical protein
MTTWRQRAWTVLLDLAASGDEFTADDVLDRAGHPDDRHEANGANSAIGSLFRRAHKERLIMPTGRVVRSRQPKRKGGMIQVWVGWHQPTLFDGGDRASTEPAPGPAL